MIANLSSISEVDGFRPWANFHDCMLSDLYVSGKVVVIVIDELYDWDAKRRKEGKVILVLQLSCGLDIFSDRDRFLRQIYRFELLPEDQSIVGVFSEFTFKIGVNFSESIMIFI